MKFKHLITYCTVASICSLSACGGGNYSRINEKQRTPSDIKISQLNTANKTIDLRFEYRTYDKKMLKTINCDIDFNSGSSKLSVNQSPEIHLDAFSTEILKFNKIDIIDSESLNNINPINYSLRCDLNYDRGNESVFEKSVLHLIPGSQSSYR